MIFLTIIVTGSKGNNAHTLGYIAIMKIHPNVSKWLYNYWLSSNRIIDGNTGTYPRCKKMNIDEQLNRDVVYDNSTPCSK